MRFVVVGRVFSVVVNSTNLDGLQNGFLKEQKEFNGQEIHSRMCGHNCIHSGPV